MTVLCLSRVLTKPSTGHEGLRAAWRSGLFGGLILAHFVSLAFGTGLPEVARARPFPLWGDGSIALMFLLSRGGWSHGGRTERHWPASDHVTLRSTPCHPDVTLSGNEGSGDTPDSSLRSRMTWACAHPVVNRHPPEAGIHPTRPLLYFGGGFGHQGSVTLRTAHPPRPSRGPGRRRSSEPRQCFVAYRR